MFDKLVESSPGRRGSGRKRGIFAIASAAVLATVAALLLLSLFDQALGMVNELGSLTRLATPITQDLTEAKVDDLKTRKEPAKSGLATRSRLVARTDSPSLAPPSKVSTDVFNGLTMPITDVLLDPGSRDKGSEGGGMSVTEDIGGVLAPGPVNQKIVKTPDPEPVKPPPPPVDEKPRYVGVVNGKALDLPKPNYPPPARVIGLKGQVKVEVLIGKDGKVVSARAVEGNPILRRPSVEAAKRSRFTSTTISGKAVEVRGIIIYNFQ